MRMRLTEEVMPYSDLPSVRERIDELFSRQMLGAVLVGKFVGDYAAVITTDLLGIHLGYILGGGLTIALFIYWDQVAAKAKEQEEKITGQTQVSEYISETEP